MYGDPQCSPFFFQLIVYFLSVVREEDSSGFSS